MIGGINIFSKWQDAELIDHDVELRKIDDIVPVKATDPETEEEEITSYSICSVKGDSKSNNAEHIWEKLYQIGANPKHLVVVDGEAVRTVSALYTPVQDRQIHDAIIEKLNDSNFPVIEDIIKPMSKFKTLGRIIIEKDVDLMGLGELFDYSITWTNSVDGSMGIQIMGAYERIICSNGLMHQHKDIDRKMHHVQVERDSNILVEKCRGIVHQVLEKKDAEIDMFQNMARCEMTEERIAWVIQKLGMSGKECNELVKHGLVIEFKKKKVEMVKFINIPMAYQDIVVDTHTEWGFFNALSEIAQRSRNLDREFAILKRSLNLIVYSRYVSQMADIPMFN